MTLFGKISVFLPKVANNRFFLVEVILSFLNNVQTKLPLEIAQGRRFRGKE